LTVSESITGKDVVENYTLMSYGIQVHQGETSSRSSNKRESSVKESVCARMCNIHFGEN